MRKALQFLTDPFCLMQLPHTGVHQDTCAFCGSREKRLYPRRYLRPVFQTPPDLEKYRDQLHRRDNGKCLSCGLEQSYYLFSDEARHVIYEKGLDVLSGDTEFDVYPPTLPWREKMFAYNYQKRLKRWDAYFKTQGIRQFSNVLHLRYQYGEALKHFADHYGAQPWGMEMVHTCKRYVEETLPGFRSLKGNLSAAVEIEEKSPSFGLIICFHTLTHSVRLTRDLEVLSALLAPEGKIIFCDEISKKLENSFHIIHPEEAMLVRILSKFFRHVERVDDCGAAEKHITPYTQKGDNPDLVAWGKK